MQHQAARPWGPAFGKETDVMKYTSTCNRTHAADACCAPATQSASRTASYLFALDTAILAVSILLSILLGVLVALAILLVLIVLVRIIPHPAVRRSVEWFPAE